MKNQLSIAAMAFLCTAVSAFSATSVTQNGITWTFDKDYPTGQFVNGDTYVIGPVKIIAITNDLNDKSFEVEVGRNGAMINPTSGNKQGFDQYAPCYAEETNVNARDDKFIAKDHPLDFRPGQSLVTSVCWMWRDKDDREEGAGNLHWWADPQRPGTGSTRPTLRSVAVLTCLDKPAPEGSFRPGYCGDVKKFYNVKDLKRDALKRLAPVYPLPDIAALTQQTERVWNDDLSNFMGSHFHPTENMPGYGRDMSRTWGSAMLVLNLDWDKLDVPKETLEKLLIQIVQHGIDLTSMADTGTHWPNNGGHCSGRKPVILFTGQLLGDEHMLDVGNWKTRFHDDEQTFYVSEADVEVTNSPRWKPDRRARVLPFTKEMVGMPEWGASHSNVNGNENDNASWDHTYRGIANGIIPAFALNAHIMGAKKLWNHDVYFDYADRLMSDRELTTMDAGTNQPTEFFRAMWATYRDKYPPVYDLAKYKQFTPIYGKGNDEE